MRNLVIVLGGQLNDDSAVYDGFDRTRDSVWMAEESTLPAVRRFERRMTALGRCVVYRGGEDLKKDLLRSIAQFQPERLVVLEPGDCRVRADLEAAAREAGVTLEIR